MPVSLILLGVYILILTAVGFFLMGQDKVMARKDEASWKRSPEGTLFLIAILGGSIGIYAGMIIFRHKTQKISFLIGLPILLVQQILLLYHYSFFLQ